MSILNSIDNIVNLGIPLGSIQTDLDGKNYIWNGYEWQIQNYGNYQPMISNANGTIPVYNYQQYWNTTRTIDTTTQPINNITVYTKDGKIFDVAQTLEKITDILGIIQPDTVLIEKYPTVSEAYYDYLKIVTSKFKEIKEAIKNYEIVVNLTKIDHNSAED
jgi:hypothetical protein